MESLNTYLTISNLAGFVYGVLCVAILTLAAIRKCRTVLICFGAVCGVWGLRALVVMLAPSTGSGGWAHALFVTGSIWSIAKLFPLLLIIIALMLPKQQDLEDAINNRAD